MKPQHLLCVLALYGTAACRTNNVAAPAQPVTAILAHTAPAPANTTANEQLVIPPTRLLLVLLDSSKSYTLYEQAVGKLLALIQALGPGDQLILAQVAGKFRPETNIKLQAKLPAVPAELLTPSPQLAEWQRKRDRLQALWQQSEQRKQVMAVYVTNHLRGKNNAVVTDLWGALDYSAQRLRQEAAVEKYLIIFSDLEHDFEKQRTPHPPLQQMSFAVMHARLFYVPWADDWKERQNEWAAWFQRAEIADFLMLESGQSDQATIVSPRPKPQLQSPVK